MMIRFINLRNPSQKSLSNVGFADDYPHAATPLWADPAVTQYILFGDDEIWNHGGTIVRDNIAYTAITSRRDTIQLNCLLEAA